VDEPNTLDKSSFNFS